MRSITMTQEQTESYDNDDADVLRELIRQAQQLANETGETVEIYTADGIVADARSPE